MVRFVEGHWELRVAMAMATALEPGAEVDSAAGSADVPRIRWVGLIWRRVAVWIGFLRLCLLNQGAVSGNWVCLIAVCMSSRVTVVFTFWKWVLGVGLLDFFGVKLFEFCVSDAF